MCALIRQVLCIVGLPECEWHMFVLYDCYMCFDLSYIVAILTTFC
jgi:hypothetical protein